MESLRRIAKTLAAHGQNKLASEIAEVSLALKAAGLPPEFLEHQKGKDDDKKKDDDKGQDKEARRR
jgi:hypothetical protein